jgi:hypothetical protein
MAKSRQSTVPFGSLKGETGASRIHSNKIQAVLALIKFGMLEIMGIGDGSIALLFNPILTCGQTGIANYHIPVRSYLQKAVVKKRISTQS